MDSIDDAQGHNEDFQNFALRQQQIGREPANYTGSECVDCEEEIPEARRKASPGCCRCITCQARAERSRSEEFEIHSHWRSL